MRETIGFEGILRIRELPEEWTHDEYLRYWCGEHPVLSAREKERYTVVEAHNQLMVAGRAAILGYIGASSGSTTPFGSYLAIGTGTLQATSPTDTALVNEVFRKALSAYTVQGSQVDINFQLTAGNAQVVMTEAGLFGGTASGTSGSGTLDTHALFSYTKGSYSVSVDYLVSLI